jgi:LysM repeat protein
MRRAVVSGLLLGALAVSSAPAGELRHEVRAGESASAIAKRYYGDYELASLLLRFNGREGTTIRPGEVLTIPYCDVHRTRSGDAWSALAQRYLGRPSLWPVVAELNDLAPQKALRVGQRLVFPVVLEHRLARGESLSSLAGRFLGDARSGGLLKEFNDLGDPRKLSVGQRIEIPLMSLRLVEGAVARKKKPETKPVASKRPAPATPAPEKKAEPKASTPAKPAADATAEVAEPPAEEPASSEPVPPPARKFEKRIDVASSAFDEGDYERARRLLEALREPVFREGADGERQRVGELLTFVYVAFDRPREACESWQAGGAADTAPDPVRVSPRVREVLAGCDGGGSAH